MSFLWPYWLLLLLTIPLLVGIYLAVLRRKRRFAIRYSSLALIREALPRRPRLRQHLPALLVLLSISSLVTALARPVAEVIIPESQTIIILALDISRSMCSTDVAPNRLAVAQDAASSFIENHSGSALVGLVAFADFAEVVVPPTNNKDRLENAVENLATALGTAIGTATLKSIDAIAKANPNIPPSGVRPNPPQEGAELLYQPAVIVLLTDGANTRGPLPLDAAQQAADRGVRVYTIGFGTTVPSDLLCTREQLGSDVLQGGLGSGRGLTVEELDRYQQFLLLDEFTLSKVAEITGGSYFRAEDAGELQSVFRNLPVSIGVQTRMAEIAVPFIALSLVLLLLAVWLSFRWNRFP